MDVTPDAFASGTGKDGGEGNGGGKEAALVRAHTVAAIRQEERQDGLTQLARHFAHPVTGNPPD